MQMYKAPPEYTDGKMELFFIQEEKLDDFPLEKIKKADMNPIWFREISLFDTKRAELNASGINVTIKIRIPKYKGINSKCVCLINGEQHEVYNVAQVVNKEGFPETEITLQTPKVRREVMENDKKGIE